MSTETPTRILRAQHQNILRLADALERVLDAGASAGSLDHEAVEDCVLFIRLYADALHHGKEEDLLFPELEAAGMPRDGGPIAVMLYEHAQGRAYCRAMADALPAARSGDEQARRRLVDAGRSYIDLIRQHIAKEDHILFQVADRLIEGPACLSLCAAYDGVCARSFDGHTVAQLEATLASLQDRYPAA